MRYVAMDREDALFSQLLWSMVEEEGAAYRREAARLAEDPEAAVPKAAERACLRRIRRETEGGIVKRSSAWRTFQRVAVVFLLLAVLTTAAVATMSHVRVWFDDTPLTDVEVVETEAYSVALPMGMTAEELEDGGMRFYLSGEEVGGVAVLDFPGAEEFFREVTTNGFLHVQEQADALAEMVKPEEPAAHMYGAGRDFLELGVTWPDVPESEELLETSHRFYPQGDVFYDVYYQKVLPFPTDDRADIQENFALKE